ncbi:MAG: hypothetical protein WCK21_11800, partial [Actinomycetota bacterium]
MEVVLVVLLAFAVAAIAWLLATQRSAAVATPAVASVPVVAQVPQQLVQQAVAVAVAQANERAARERDMA